MIITDNISTARLTSKNSKAKWVSHLSNMFKSSSVQPIKGAVLNFVKKGIHPIQP